MTAPNPAPKRADDYLRAAAAEMADRAASRDQPDGERSMAATVGAFNILFGHDLTETEGWQFLCLLKIRRGAAGEYREDDHTDQVAYAALAAESAAAEQRALIEAEVRHFERTMAGDPEVIAINEMVARVMAKRPATKAAELDDRIARIPEGAAGGIAAINGARELTGMLQISLRDIQAGMKDIAPLTADQDVLHHNVRQAAILMTEVAERLAVAASICQEARSHE